MWHWRLFIISHFSSDTLYQDKHKSCQPLYGTSTSVQVTRLCVLEKKPNCKWQPTEFPFALVWMNWVGYRTKFSYSLVENYWFCQILDFLCLRQGFSANPHYLKECLKNSPVPRGSVAGSVQWKTWQECKILSLYNFNKYDSKTTVSVACPTEKKKKKTSQLLNNNASSCDEL